MFTRSQKTVFGNFASAPTRCSKPNSYNILYFGKKKFMFLHYAFPLKDQEACEHVFGFCLIEWLQILEESQLDTDL